MVESQDRSVIIGSVSQAEAQKAPLVLFGQGSGICLKLIGQRHAGLTPVVNGLAMTAVQPLGAWKSLVSCSSAKSLKSSSKTGLSLFAAMTNGERKPRMLQKRPAVLSWHNCESGERSTMCCRSSEIMRRAPKRAPTVPKSLQPRFARLIGWQCNHAASQACGTNAPPKGATGFAARCEYPMHSPC